VDETYIKIKGTSTYLYRAVDAFGNTLCVLLSPTRDAEAAKRFFEKALHSSAASAPGAHLVEEQVAEPTAAANPVMPAPRVINVDKNAAYRHQPLPNSKPAGRFLPLSNERPGQISQQPRRARPPFYQTLGQAWDGLFLVRDGLANLTGI
jgi:IS6 family transposase